MGYKLKNFGRKMDLRSRNMFLVKPEVQTFIFSADFLNVFCIFPVLKLTDFLYVPEDKSFHLLESITKRLEDPVHLLRLRPGDHGPPARRQVHSGRFPSCRGFGAKRPTNRRRPTVNK